MDSGADKGARSLLLIKPGSMGDVLHALPVVSAIHRARPDIALTWVVDPRWAPLLEGHPAVTRLRHFPRQEFRGIAGWGRALRWYAGLRGLRPDWVVDLQGLLRSALMAKCSGGREIYGLSDAREGAGFFYTRWAKTDPAEHAVRRYLRCLPLLGIGEPETCEFVLPVGGVPSGVPRDCLVLHPYARGAGKSMTSEAIRAFVHGCGKGRKIVLVGVGRPPESLPPEVLDLTGKTSLGELIGIFRGARFVVSVDSGPMHLAAALGVPLLGIHTWSDPRLVGPYREDAWIWQGGEIRRQDFKRPPLAEQPFTPEAAGEVARFVMEEG